MCVFIYITAIISFSVLYEDITSVQFHPFNYLVLAMLDQVNYSIQFEIRFYSCGVQHKPPVLLTRITAMKRMLGFVKLYFLQYLQINST